MLNHYHLALDIALSSFGTFGVCAFSVSLVCFGAFDPLSLRPLCPLVQLSLPKYVVCNYVSIYACRVIKARGLQQNPATRNLTCNATS